MGRYIARKLGWAVLTLVVVVLLTFVLLRLTGDPISEGMAAGGASPEEIAQARQALGYDRPIPVQFVDYFTGLFVGDFGTSLQYGGPALTIVLQRLPMTLYLAAVSLVMTLALAIPAGLMAARRPGGWADRIVSAVSGVMLSVPSFVLGAALILVFGVSLRLLPISGAGQPAAVILPALTLAVYPAARLARIIRASMVEVATMDFVRLGRAKGLPEGTVQRRFVFRNALLPVVTVLGIQMTFLIGGAVVVEAVFAWPGLGGLTTSALSSSDFDVVQTIVLIVAIGVILINFLTDVAYSLIDPRIRYS